MATNITFHPLGAVSASERAELLKQENKAFTIWFTGLSGAGKTTIACALEQHLLRMQHPAYRLASHAENVRRVAEVARLFADARCIPIVAFIVPFRAGRAMARALHVGEELGFVEVFVDAPLEVAEARDPKGLYKLVREGKIQDFTGISSPYEPPEDPDVHIRTDMCTVQDAVQTTVEYLEKHDYL